jgi:hypothetical protein
MANPMPAPPKARRYRRQPSCPGALKAMARAANDAAMAIANEAITQNGS